MNEDEILALKKIALKNTKSAFRFGLIVLVVLFTIWTVIGRFIPHRISNITVTLKIWIEAVRKKLDSLSVHPFIKQYQHVLLTVLISLIIVMGMSSFSCTEKPMTQTKASSTLLLQVALRQQQLASPTAERLAQMQSRGMRTENIGIQRIYIYLSQQLIATQADELRALGITLYLDSWIPPVGNHPTGFILADMPVDNLDALAAKDYVVKLDTAETKAEPQSSPS